MTTIRNYLAKLEDYLDDQPWWQRTYWPIWRFGNDYNPVQLCREAKWFIQRGRRGYSDRDLWNANDHIARVTLAFINNGQKRGIPVSFCKDGEPWERSVERWQKVIDEIRWLMEQHLEDDLEKWLDPEHRERVERANKLFGRWWMALWD